jgi:hypothetical protein
MSLDSVPVPPRPSSASGSKTRVAFCLVEAVAHPKYPILIDKIPIHRRARKKSRFIGFYPFEGAVCPINAGTALFIHNA